MSHQCCLPIEVLNPVLNMLAKVRYDGNVSLVVHLSSWVGDETGSEILSAKKTNTLLTEGKYCFVGY